MSCHPHLFQKNPRLPLHCNSSLASSDGKRSELPREMEVVGQQRQICGVAVPSWKGYCGALLHSRLIQMQSLRTDRSVWVGSMLVEMVSTSDGEMEVTRQYLCGRWSAGACAGCQTQIRPRRRCPQPVSCQRCTPQMCNRDLQ